MAWCWSPVIWDLCMDNRLDKLSREYCAVLRRYLIHHSEDLRQQAYELGRKAIREKLGVLDLARVHQQAMVSCLAPFLSHAQSEHTLKAAETFFLEMLSPFEATHRGFREANASLHHLN